MRLVIDGRTVEAAPGQTVLEVARANGIYIPSLCWHPRTGKAGRCRACLVEIEGVRGLKESCVQQAKEGMVVRTNTEAVLAARRMVVEFLLANGQHDCLSCEANGRCELQEMTYHLGIERPPLVIEREEPEADASAEGIIRDLKKCIQCGRCVASCNHNVMHEVLDFGGRGAHCQVICDDDRPMGDSSCVQCGECVQVCPVGALVFKPSKGQARWWDTEKKQVICPYCGVGCVIDVHVKDNRVMWALGTEDRWEKRPNKGMLCVKGRFGLEFLNRPDRLTKPLVRRSKGAQLEEASWEEALDTVARRLREVREQHGASALGFFTSAKQTNEENYAMMRLARGVLKTNNIDHCARL